MSDWVQQHNAQVRAANTPQTARSVLHGITDADLDRQAELDVARGRARGYAPVSQVRGEKDGIKTLTIEYSYTGHVEPIPAQAGPAWVAVPAGGQVVVMSGHSRIVAALLAIFLGGFGLHKFYLGKVAQGVLYVIFVWTLIPSLIGFIEGVIYLATSDAEFAARYP